MFFIYGTDAPIYHYPIVTAVMVVINVAIHFFVSVTGYDVTPWILAFGDGFHPLQWVTHNFLHIGWLHLIGNMIFLVPFGLIVEGKIGWWRMLILYMAIGTVQGFSQQAIMLSSDPIDDAEALVEMFDNPNNPLDQETKEELTKQWRKDLMKEGFGSLGASAVIFGLLAVCAIWAPVNEFDVYFRWSLLVPAADGGDREWSVLTVCGIFVVKEFFMFLMMGMPISSEALHLNGFVVGAMVGLATLYYGWVDCEGFDLISLWTGKPFVSKRTLGQQRREREAALEAARPKGPPQAVVPKMAHELEAKPSPVMPAVVGGFGIATASSGTSAAAPLPAVTAPPAVPGQPVVPGQVMSAEDPAPPFSSVASKPSSGVAEPLPIGFIDDAGAAPQGDGGAGWFDADLPSFDDGQGDQDPLERVRHQTELLVAQGKFTQAVKELAATRKQHTGFVLSPVPMGRLAEGLLQENHIKPALTVLSIGCDAYPAYAARWRIRQASIELAANKDPIKAIKQLRSVDKDQLDSQLRAQYLKVAEQAKRMAGR